MEIQKNIKLAKYTTFNIGGKAEYFTEVKNIDELRKALDFAKSKKLKVFTLGGGSNILLPDRSIQGLTIKLGIKGIIFKDNIVYAGAGELWDSVVARTVARNLGGIENLSLIPGTVGGAIFQNIGAYGVELKDVIDTVDVLDLKTGKIEKFSGKKCSFGYRTSIFQKPIGKKYVILGAYLKLHKNNYKLNLSYSDLKTYFADKIPTIGEIRKVVIKIRKTKLVYPTKDMGTVGSFFKNPVIPTVDFKTLIIKYPYLIGRDLGNNKIKLFAGQLTEKTGWKGKRIGNVGVSKKHAMVLVSYRGAKSKDILNLAELIQKSVKTKFGIKLEPEVKIML